MIRVYYIIFKLLSRNQDNFIRIKILEAQYIIFNEILFTV